MIFSSSSFFFGIENFIIVEEMPTKGLEDVLAALESKLAYLPGGRDREGRPLIVVNVPSELQPTTKPRLESIILYFLSIFR